MEKIDKINPIQKIIHMDSVIKEGLLEDFPILREDFKIEDFKNSDNFSEEYKQFILDFNTFIKETGLFKRITSYLLKNRALFNAGFVSVSSMNKFKDIFKDCEYSKDMRITIAYLIDKEIKPKFSDLRMLANGSRIDFRDKFSVKDLIDTVNISKADSFNYSQKKPCKIIFAIVSGDLVVSFGEETVKVRYKKESNLVVEIAGATLDINTSSRDVEDVVLGEALLINRDSQIKKDFQKLKKEWSNKNLKNSIDIKAIQTNVVNSSIPETKYFHPETKNRPSVIKTFEDGHYIVALGIVSEEQYNGMNFEKYKSLRKDISEELIDMDSENEVSRIALNFAMAGEQVLNCIGGPRHENYLVKRSWFEPNTRHPKGLSSYFYKEMAGKGMYFGLVNAKGDMISSMETTVDNDKNIISCFHEEGKFLQLYGVQNSEVSPEVRQMFKEFIDENPNVESVLKNIKGKNSSIDVDDIEFIKSSCSLTSSDIKQARLNVFGDILLRIIDDNLKYTSPIIEAEGNITLEVNDDTRIVEISGNEIVSKKEILIKGNHSISNISARLVAENIVVTKASKKLSLNISSSVEDLDLSKSNAEEIEIHFTGVDIKMLSLPRKAKKISFTTDSGENAKIVNLFFRGGRLKRSGMTVNTYKGSNIIGF